jgi:hypothetical protein
MNVVAFGTTSSSSTVVVVVAAGSVTVTNVVIAGPVELVGGVPVALKVVEVVLRRGKKAAGALVGNAVALAKGRDMVKGSVAVTTIVVSETADEEFMPEVGVAVVLAGIGVVVLLKKPPWQSLALMSLLKRPLGKKPPWTVETVVIEVRVVLSITEFVTVTKVVISGPEKVGVAVMLKLEVAVVFGKKGPGTLAANVLDGEKEILRFVELDRLDDAEGGKEPLKEKLGVVKVGVVLEVVLEVMLEVMLEVVLEPVLEVVLEVETVTVPVEVSVLPGK